MKTLLILITLLSTQLFASVATITALRGKASIQRDGAMIVAALGATLEEKDNIVTQDNTKLQVIFKDETIISIGKNSNFSINEYLFEDNQAPIAKFSMLRGAMRTITGHIGDIAPEKFSVATKTATIGIRGTNFSVVVGEDGSYNAFCTYGAISVSLSGQTHLVRQGFFISVAPSGKVSVKAFSPQDLKNMKKENFETTGSKTAKSGVTAPDGSPDAGNNRQIDVTKVDTSKIVITELTEVTTDGVQEEESRDDLAALPANDLTTLLAGYTMNNAAYTGTHTTSSIGAADGTDIANLNIDFGANTITLQLRDSYNNNNVAVEYSVNPSFSGTTFNVDVDKTAGVGPVSGSATGTFTGTTGNSVNGSHTYNYEGYDNTGTYNVTTSQVLE